MAVRTGISPLDLLDTPMPILAAMVRHLTGNHESDPYDVDIEEVAVSRE